MDDLFSSNFKICSTNLKKIKPDNEFIFNFNIIDDFQSIKSTNSKNFFQILKEKILQNYAAKSSYWRFLKKLFNFLMKIFPFLSLGISIFIYYKFFELTKEIENQKKLLKNQIIKNENLINYIIEIKSDLESLSERISSISNVPINNSKEIGVKEITDFALDFVPINSNIKKLIKFINKKIF